MSALRLALLAALGLAAACDRSPDRSLLSPASAQNRGAVSAALDLTRRTAIVDAATSVAPSVVSITVSSRRRVAERGMWDLFFIPRESERLVQSSGTGFILRSDGVIVTNQHVIAGADRITVTLANGTDLEGQLVGEDATTDIAVIRVERTNLPPARLGRSTDLLIGEWVVAVGNPYAYYLGNTEPTVTAGVVSAVHRNILPNEQQPGLYLDMIQTDAAINPGNSGGPLTNALGEIVGVSSSIFTGGGGSVGSIGLGFAIPIERAVRVADEILRNKAVRRAWTGLDVAGPAAMQDWKRQGGVLVTRVAPGGPAARAGIGEGAVLLEANGRRLRNYLDWEAVKLDLHVGDQISLRVRQGGRDDSRTIITGDLPTATAAKVTVLNGIEAVSVTEAIQTERGLRSSRGALIVRITDEVKSATGLAEGDVIVGINRTTVANARQLADLLESLVGGQLFRIWLERQSGFISTDLVFR